MSKSHDDNEINQTNNDNAIPAENELSKPNRSYLINEENFNRLRQFQQEIFKLSEMTPSFRKVVNALINDENLNVLKAKLLKEINS
jgi:hypothetical protein